MLDQRWRRYTNIDPALGQRLMFVKHNLLLTTLRAVRATSLYIEQQIAAGREGTGIKCEAFKQCWFDVGTATQSVG